MGANDKALRSAAREVLETAGELVSVAARRDVSPDALEAANRVLRAALDVATDEDVVPALERAAEALRASRDALASVNAS